ncbi:MAG: acyl-CoA dehydrogenase family protein [SAR324 cluster bacterium]
MDLRYSEEQDLIQQQARQFFERECSLDTVRKAWASEAGLPEPLWKRMAELGWLGALLPERLGGQELSVTAFSRIAEEMGRGLLPGGYLSHLLAALAIRLAGAPAQQQALLPPLARGETRVALARCMEGGRFDPAGGRFYADEKPDGYLLFGEKLAVPGLAQASEIVVSAVLGLPEPLSAGLVWFVVPRSLPGVVVKPLHTLEGGLKAASLRFDGVRIAASARLGAADRPADGAGVLARVSQVAEVALAFDALGGAARVTELTVEYAKLRMAFGQPIGAYQAVKHKCADMIFAVENLRAIASWAAWVLDAPAGQTDASPALASAMARATAIECYDLVIRHGTQAHGAIAVTEEHALPLYAKRSKTLALAFGGLAHYQEQILKESGYRVPPVQRA